MASKDIQNKKKLALFSSQKELATFVELIKTHDKVDEVIEALKGLKDVKLSSKENKELLNNIIKEVKKKEVQIEIDDKLKEELRGNPGDTPVKGVDYDDGEPGYTPIKGKDYFDGDPGKDYIITEEDYRNIALEVESQLSTIIPQEVKENITAEGIRDLLEELVDDERLDGKHIKNITLPEDTEILIDGRLQKIKHGLGGSTARNLFQLLDVVITAPTEGQHLEYDGTKWVNLDDVGSNNFYKEQIGVAGSNYPSFTGALDGANTVYTVAQGEYITGSLTVSLNGKGDANGSSGGWSETDPASGTFTFETAPESGDYIYIEYQVASTTSGNADTVDGYHASAFVLKRTLQVKSTNYTILTTDRGVLASGTVTITLPTAVSEQNDYKVTNIGTGVVTVDTTNSETINGSTSIDLEAQQSRTFDSNNVNWFIG